MAFVWGPQTLGGGGNQSANFGLNYAASSDLLPYISVVPTEATFAQGGQWYSGGFPVFGMLGVSTQWSELSNDGKTLTFWINVMNNGNNPVEFNIVYTNF
jgi:hypothetical protein